MPDRTADLILQGPQGPLRVRVYEPSSPSSIGLVWAHGGAFVGGDLDMPEADQVARRLAGAGVVVVSVDYALAPVTADWAEVLAAPERDGARYPVPQNELVFAWNWARAADLGPPASSWSLGGASAGASLAAASALIARDAGEVPRSVVLAYPTVHPVLPESSTELAAAMAGVPEQRRFRPPLMRVMNEGHAGGPLEGDRLLAFAGGRDLVGMPPVLIVDSEHDDLRASGEQFARELRAAGVDVTSGFEPGTFHGHLNDLDAAAALRSIATIAGFLQRASARSGPPANTPHHPSQESR